MELELRPDQITASNTVRETMTKASDYITDEAQASTVPELYPWWAKADWRDYKLGTIRRHKDKLWKFNQPSLVDESQNAEPGTNETLWSEVAYHDGVRIIPNPITTTKAFALGELGWWPVDGNVYRSKMAGNTHQPNVTNPPWERVEAGQGSDPEQPDPEEPAVPAIATWDSLPANHPFAVGDKFTDGGKTYEVKRVFTKQAHFRPPTLTGDYYVIIA